MNEDIELFRVKKLQKQKFFGGDFFLTNRQKSCSCRTNILKLQITFVSTAKVNEMEKKRKKEII